MLYLPQWHLKFSPKIGSDSAGWVTCGLTPCNSPLMLFQENHVHLPSQNPLNLLGNEASLVEQLPRRCYSCNTLTQCCILHILILPTRELSLFKTPKLPKSKHWQTHKVDSTEAYFSASLHHWKPAGSPRCSWEHSLGSEFWHRRGATGAERASTATLTTDSGD